MSLHSHLKVCAILDIVKHVFIKARIKVQAGIPYDGRHAIVIFETKFWIYGRADLCQTLKGQTILTRYQDGAMEAWWAQNGLMSIGAIWILTDISTGVPFDRAGFSDSFVVRPGENS